MRRALYKNLIQLSSYLIIAQFALAFVLAFNTSALVRLYVLVSVAAVTIRYVAPTVLYKRSARLSRLRKTPQLTHTDREWASVLADFGNRCASCRSTGKLTKDHIIPISRGGADAIWNIQPLCQSCNSKKGTKIIAFRKEV